MNPSQLNSIRMFCFRLSIVLLINIGAGGNLFSQTYEFKLGHEMKIDSVGNVQLEQTLDLPPVAYSLVKDFYKDAFRALRGMESNSGWLERTNQQANFVDKRHCVTANCDVTGLVKTRAKGLWCVDMSNSDLEVLDVSDELAVFGTVEQTELGIVRNYLRVHPPAGTKNMKWDAQQETLTYEYHPEIADGGITDVGYDLQPKERIMSSLAKVYSTEHSALFAARHFFTNTGQRPVYDYRVRFKINEYSEWSAWKKCKIVYPGQRVLDYFYPVFDIDKLTSLTGSRHAMVISEVQYTTEDGEAISETDGKRTLILSRNEVVFSSREDNENIDWFEQFDLIPFILTCFADGADPVIQQFAGRVSSLANGPAASLAPEHALAYLAEVWNTMEANQVAYQTPPSLSFGDHFGQHVKTGRDVLRNRAGTCLDLSIFWASAAESVGLVSHIAVIPGHAFPVIELPGGEMFPIESTRIGKSTFKEAVQEGFATFKQAQQDGKIILVDVTGMRNEQGIHSLDLPRLDESVLTQWGYTFEKQQLHVDQTAATVDAAKDQQEQARQDAERQMQERQQRIEQELQQQSESEQSKTAPVSRWTVGVWKSTYVQDGIQIVSVCVITADGGYEAEYRFTNSNGAQIIGMRGTIADLGDRFRLDTNMGIEEVMYKKINDTTVEVYAEGEPARRLDKIK